MSDSTGGALSTVDCKLRVGDSGDPCSRYGGRLEAGSGHLEAGCVADGVVASMTCSTSSNLPPPHKPATSPAATRLLPEDSLLTGSCFSSLQLPLWVAKPPQQDGASG